MKSLLKKVIRMAPNVFMVFGMLVFFVCLPVFLIFMEGLWVGFLNILALILAMVAIFIASNWLDDLGQWAKEEGE